MTTYNITVRVGQWQTVTDSVQVPDLEENTLRAVAKKHWQAMADAALKATQVLIWDDDRFHNLVAVYTPAIDKLTYMP